ncbi:hypothetical protein [Nocardioides panacisoli]|uniref:Uncharacterized protein n=1 Tax=Nocardioides panacisoli TaxID=627624 RepID=A0ABP7IH12_9ACTN
MRIRLRILGVTVALGTAAIGIPLLTSTPSAEAAGFTGGDLVVYRVGAPGGTLSNAAAPVFVDEFSPSGAPVGSTALPTTAADGNLPLTAAGESRSEGLISRSPDGRFVSVTGYAAAPGATGPGGTSLTATAPGTVARVVGIVDAHGGVDTSTALTGAGAPSIVRSAVTENGDDILATGGNGGVLAATLGGSSTSVSAGGAGSNLNQLSYQAGGLFTSGILDDRLALVGSGGNLTEVPGLPANLLTYGYAVLDLSPGVGWNGTTADTIYLANAAERAGTVDKYRYSGSTWTLAGSVDVPGVSGLVADVDGSSVSLAVTTPAKLLALTDPSGAGSTFGAGAPTVLASAAAGTEFRGVALAPTADPGPSLFVRTPTRDATVSIGGATVPVTAYATGGTVSGVTVKIGSATAHATKGAGNIWTADVPTAGLSAGNATITVTATNGDGTTTATRPVVLSGSSVPKGALAAGTHAPSESKIKQSGTWKAYSVDASPTGKGLKSTKKGASLTAKVYGKKLAISFTGGPTAGKVQIVVDGETPTVDLYSDGTKTVTKTFRFSGDLAAHTVVIKNTGSKSAKSTGTTVAVAVLKVS